MSESYTTTDLIEALQKCRPNAGVSFSMMICDNQPEDGDNLERFYADRPLDIVDEGNGDYTILLDGESNTITSTGLRAENTQLADRVKVLEKQREILAKAIVNSAAELGIVTEVNRGYSGPDVLMLLDDITGLATQGIKP